ncbi:UPF0223 family protein [Lactiplantibacillus fabifermentans]|nr:UPF0223 family protein [Lactiplantibacillus fabifermentans]KRO27156.1 hypothetical protein DY78_GL000314 [Lactiplantibacillus fabifermentans DSM 21115]
MATTNHENYQYPLDETWNTQDIIIVTDFYQKIEAANESSVPTADLIKAYRAFKTVVPAKSQEKQLGRAFEAASGYSIYHTMQAATATNKQRFQFRG